MKHSFYTFFLIFCSAVSWLQAEKRISTLTPSSEEAWESTFASLDNAKALELAHTIARDCSFSVQQINQFGPFPFIITQPGLYCLGQNVNLAGTGAQTAITIQINTVANSTVPNPNAGVIINLNGFTILGNGGNSTGIYNPGYSRVMVLNGAINNMGTAAISITTGVSNTPRLFAFENLLFNNNAIGIRLRAANNFTIAKCLAANFNSISPASTYGFYLDSTLNGTIEKTYAFNNGTGFYGTTNTNLIVTKCVSNNNTNFGFNYRGGNNIIFEKCLASNNLIGFSLANNPTNFSLQKCVAANNNSTGFTLQGSQHTVEQCRAQDNAQGFILYGNNHTILESKAIGNRDTGFLCAGTVNGIAGATQCQVRNNTATANSIGFSNSSINNHFYTNFANNNVTNTITKNFVGIPNVIVSPTPAQPINFTANISE